MNKLFLMSRDTPTPVLNYWTPSLIDTSLWLDASDPATITQDLNKVSKWDDKSKNNRHAVQIQSLRQPIIGARTINNKNAIDFDGTINNFTMPTFPNPTTSGLLMIVIDADTTDAIDMRLYNGQVGTATRFFLARNFDNIRFNLSNPASTLDRTYKYGKTIVAGYRDVNNLGVGYDGIYTVAEKIQTPPTLTKTFIGAYEGSGNFYDGAIGEIIVLDYYTESDRQKLEGYLAHKWGLSANLSVVHPYKISAPMV